MDNKPKRVMILGAYGQRNLGDDALLQVFTSAFPDAQIMVNSADPDDTRRRYGVEAITTYGGVPRFRRLRAFASADLIVFGGGSLLKEIEGSTIARLLYFARIFAILLFGKLLGRTTAMLGVGVGPLDGAVYRRLSRYAANLTDLICVRDTASRDLLLAIGVRRPVHVTADAVFLLPPVEPEAAPATADPYVVVVPRYSLTAAEQTQFAAICDHMATAYGVRLVFVPFQTGFLPRYDDLPAVHAIIEQMQHRERTSVVASNDPHEVMALIAGADMVVSARLHALIFAAINGVAPVALSYEVKVQSFMAEIGLPGASVSLEAVRQGKLTEVVDSMWSRRSEIAPRLRERAGVLRQKARRSFTLLDEQPSSSAGRMLLTGGMLLFLSTTIVNAGNYIFNLILGRWLGPASFADLSTIITLFLVITLVTATLQTVMARYAAIAAASNDSEYAARLRHWMNRLAWMIGIACAAIFVAGAPVLQAFFHTQSAWPFVMLGLGVPLYFVQGVDRGVLQGQTRFGRLAASYQAEMAVRLLVALPLVALGYGTTGASFALLVSFAATWVVARQVRRGLEAHGPLSNGERAALLAFGGPVGLSLVGQVLINNSDVLIVKHFFSAADAGAYAALALTGRIIFFATWSVVTTMFPIVAQKHERGEPHRHLLYLSMGVVLAISGVMILATFIAPAQIITLLFGPAYVGIAGLLGLYSITTMLYALANVVISYRLSTGHGGGSYPAALAGVVQIIGLWNFHNSLQEVVVVQTIILATLFCVLLIWDGWLNRAERRAVPAAQPATHQSEPRT